MCNRNALRFIVLGWVLVMVASCSYGRGQALPTRSPTASTQVVTERTSNPGATPTTGPLPSAPTSQLSQPTPLREGMPSAIIGGRLCFGSERIPPMTVYARNIDTGATFSINVERGSLNYTLEVPAPANYIVFAWTTGDPFGSTPFAPSDSRGGMYTCAGDFVGQMQYFGKGRANPKCYGPNTPVPLENHTPIVVRARPGEQISDAFICDFDIGMSVPQP